MRPTRAHVAVPAVLLFAGAVVVACGDSGGSTGTACGAPADCYPDVDPSTIAGTVTCLDRVPDGYCTHTCAADSECCAADGECPDGHAEVCSPIESAGETYCFLSCEAADVGGGDADAYCRDYAGPDFGCRSTGGGAANRKVCLP
jgi:hypothetical protein